MENNTAQKIEEITNKAQLLGILPGPQKYYVQFLTANAGLVGSRGAYARRRYRLIKR